MHTHNGMLVSHDKEWNLAICYFMVGASGYYAKWNKSDRERQILYDFTCMWTLRITKRMIQHNRISYKYREQIGGCQRGGNEEEKRNRWEKLRATNFQLQNKLVMNMKKKLLAWKMWTPDCTTKRTTYNSKLTSILSNSYKK